MCMTERRKLEKSDVNRQICLLKQWCRPDSDILIPFVTLAWDDKQKPDIYDTRCMISQKGGGGIIIMWIIE